MSREYQKRQRDLAAKIKLRKTNLTIGDVVQLKSGGPDMTVQDVSVKGNGNVRLVWFRDGEIMERIFNEAHVKKIA